MRKAKFKGIKPPTPQRLKELKQKGYTQKDIATVYGVNERTVRNWKKDKDKPQKQRGRPPKIGGKLLTDFSFFLWGLKRKKVWPSKR
jgi:transposase